ncbi:hypothetical protein EVG20_g5993 [Dentipellis fragilis]|uniref:Uncharacterized protein n=1 Tax=Dentipellis fragilis TaxID=205917 RepID=A0A4Y9YR78_9AGAM|nr:hypothetical protein EVG20_g5993 [Dentipellis fragilis]
MRKRKLKSSRKKRERQSQADPHLYHGARAQFHYFQCLQLLLRKQIVALTKVWDMPPKFEITCRDIWALHLSLLPTPPPAEPLLHELEIEGSGISRKNAAEEPESPRSPSPAKALEPIAEHGSDDEGPPSDREPDPEAQGQSQAQAGSSKSSSSSSSSEDSDGEPEADPEMEELLRELSESSSEEEEDAAESGPKPAGAPRERKARGAEGRHDGPASNLAVLVLALWTMRIPVMYLDLIRLIEAYELPYLDPIRFLPPDMARHLTKQTVSALSPPHAPSPVLLQVLAARLARQMNNTYGISTPELNAAPILWRVIRALGGTPVLYSLAKTVGYVLSLPLTLHHTLAPGLVKVNKKDPSRHIYDNVPPEVALAATIVLVLKMVYGLDGRPRCESRVNLEKWMADGSVIARSAPKDTADPACALPSIQDYLKVVQDLNDQTRRSKEEIFSAKSNMATACLDDSMIDEYLRFCEKALLGHGVAGTELRVIAEYFPLGSRASESSSPTDGESTAGVRRENALKAAQPAEDATDEEPGAAYTIYNSGDVLGTVSEEYETVVGRAARATGVGDEYMGGVVEKYERRLARWWDGHPLHPDEASKSRGGFPKEIYDDSTARSLEIWKLWQEVGTQWPLTLLPQAAPTRSTASRRRRWSLLSTLTATKGLFSAPGESGSIIVGGLGRIVGFLSGSIPWYQRVWLDQRYIPDAVFLARAAHQGSLPHLLLPLPDRRLDCAIDARPFFSLPLCVFSSFIFILFTDSLPVLACRISEVPRIILSPSVLECFRRCFTKAVQPEPAKVGKKTGKADAESTSGVKDIDIASEHHDFSQIRFLPIRG